MRLYELVVGRGGVSPAHFFYNMTLPEVAAFVRGMEEKEKNEWEKVRMHVFKVAQILSGGDMEPADIMRLPWDKEKGPVEVDMNELDRIKQIARRLENE